MPVTSKMPSFVLEPEDTPFTFNVNDTKQRKVFPLAKLEPVNVWYGFNVSELLINFPLIHQL